MFISTVFIVIYQTSSDFFNIYKHKNKHNFKPVIYIICQYTGVLISP